ncbi:28S ribosomal protein S24, mitochondrial [Sparganum proliferum]
MSQPLTYEQAKKPHQIGVLKSWNSWNSVNLHDETEYTGVVTWHDALIRLFILGTFPTHVLSEVIIKRQANMVHISFLLSNRLSPTEIYFLIGYGEQMLSMLLRSPVKIEPRMVLDPKDVIFRYV